MPVFYDNKLDSSRNILGLAFLVSLLIHLLFFTTFPSQLFPSTNTAALTPKERMIRVKRIPPKEQGRIVDIQDEKSVTKETVDTDYLSDKNRKVEKQTKSLSIPTPQSQPTPAKQQPKEEVEKKSKYKLDLSEKALQKVANNDAPKLAPQSMSSNYLPEITIGNDTLLNTKEFAFHGFYIRMKREIEGFWHPDRSVPMNEALQGTYITTINVVLDDQGYLISANVVKSSGIQSLDFEAKHAIEKASPYPNPPKELLNDDRKIHVNWSFIFDRTSLL